MMVERVGDALERLAREHPSETIVVACHGGVIGCSFEALAGVRLNSLVRYTENTAITEWQFGEHGTIPGLEETLAALDSFGPWSQVSWFISPNTRLGGRSPLSVLREGQVEQVVRAAQLYGEQGG